MTHLVTMVVFARFGFLDVVGPADVFAHANQLASDELYRIVVAGTAGSDDVCAESGMRLGVDCALAEVQTTDTLLVSGGFGVHDVPATAVEQVARLSESGARIASVCSGAFVLARAGLLDGRRATTHWAWADELQRRHPAVDVVADELFVFDGAVVTAAGVAAGIDLALGLVRQDHGEVLARSIAQRMVLYVVRFGGQSQFSERLSSVLSGAHQGRIESLIGRVVADPAGRHTTAAMAKSLGLSERHLTRLFHQYTGTTPARWVERVRVDRARELLERPTTSIDSIAQQSGFGSPDTMRQAFHRVLGMTPSQYRAVHGRSDERRQPSGVVMT